MNIARTSKSNLAFLIILLITVIYIISGIILGQPQDARFDADWQKFQDGNNLLKQGKVNEAARNFNELLRTHQDSYLLYWSYAEALTAQGKYQEALSYYNKSKTQRPFVVTEPSYLFEYAQVSYKLGDYEVARKYLTRAQLFINDDLELAKRVQELLQETNKKLGLQSGENNGK